MLLTSISISPNTATLDLAGTATQAFRVEGTDATYTWTIINEKNEAGTAATAGTIAEITSGAAASNSVTVHGLAAGTFTLQAVPTGAGETLTSGTITVVQGYLKGDADGSGSIDATDALYILHTVAGNITSDQLKGNCDVDKSGVIDATDALYVLHYVAGNITSFD
jgi:hypothetical protein